MQITTQTKTVTNTHIALATLAMVGASAVALIAAPMNSSENAQLAQVNDAAPAICAPMRTEFSRPSPRTNPGKFKRIRYRCPGTPNQQSSITTARYETREALSQRAARFCQSRRKCAAPAPAGYGYNVNRESSATSGSASSTGQLPNLTFVASSIFEQPVQVTSTPEGAMDITVRLQNNGSAPSPQIETRNGIKIFALDAQNNKVVIQTIAYGNGKVESRYSYELGVSPLASGSSMGGVSSFSLPVPAGAQSLKFVIDPSNLVAESNESDNEITVVIPAEILNVAR